MALTAFLSVAPAHGRDVLVRGKQRSGASLVRVRHRRVRRIASRSRTGALVRVGGAALQKAGPGRRGARLFAESKRMLRCMGIADEGRID